MEDVLWHPLEHAAGLLPGVSGVYVVRHTQSGKEYVGISKNIRKRLSRHREAKHPKCLLHRAIRAHGRENFEACLLLAVSLGAMASEEVKAIARRKTLHPAGYNLTPGGGRSDVWKRDPERAQELAKQNSARHKGRKRSALTCERLSAALRGRKQSPEQVAKLIARQTGSKMPETTRKALTAARSRKVWWWPPGSMVPLEFESIEEAVAQTGRARSGLCLILAGKGKARDGSVFAYVEERKTAGSVKTKKAGHEARPTLTLP